MKKILLCIVILLLTGCIGGNRSEYITIHGVIYHYATEIPIANGNIEISHGGKNHPLQTNIDGSFKITLFTKNSQFKIEVTHPDYLPSNVQLSKKQAQQKPILIEMQPLSADKVLITGRIDYALPILTDSLGRSLNLATYPHDLDTGKSEIELTQIIVQPTANNSEIIEEIITSLNPARFEILAELGLIILTKQDHVEINDFLTQARSHYLVQRADMDYPIYPLTSYLPVTPDDDYYHKQWNFDAIYLPNAWSLAAGGLPVKVAILDTRVDTKHDDLTLSPDAYNVITEDPTDVLDWPGRILDAPNSHGTHVAGIIGANTNNNLGVAGVAWGINLELIPIVVLNDDNRGTVSNLIQGIEQAIALDVDIINMSLGLRLDNPYSHLLYDSILAATNEGIILVAAAGNTTELLFPAKYSEVIAVGATNVDYRISRYSVSNQVEIFAPGGSEAQGVYSTDINGYTYGAGTSMAAPHVSGLAALIRARNPYITTTILEELLWETGIVFNLNYPEQRLINTYAALTATPISDATITFSNDQSSSTYYLNNINDDRYFSQFLVPGSYTVTAHIDANDDQIINSGDWYYQEEITILPNQHLDNWEIRLEIYQ